MTVDVQNGTRVGLQSSTDNRTEYSDVFLTLLTLGYSIQMHAPFVNSQSILGPGDLSTDIARVGDVVSDVICFNVSPNM